MIKQNSNSTFRNFLRSYISDKTSLVICFICFIILIGIYFTFYQKKTLNFYPDKKDVHIYFYNDKIDKGNSSITDTLVSDSLAKMRFILNDGFISPYASIGFENKSYINFDLSDYNKIQFQLSGENIKSVLIYLILKNDEIKEDALVKGDNILSRYIDVNKGRGTFDIDMNDFNTPDWWFEKHNLSPSIIRNHNLGKIYRITFGPGLMPKLKRELSLNIYSIIFYRDNTLVIFVMSIIQLIIIVLLFVIFYFRTRTKKQPKSVTINYQAVKLDQKPKIDSGFLDYISENFHDSELSLLIIAEKTGVSQRYIAENILSSFNCNVKTYINQIRINEAKRLLKETNLNSGEIAYKVGFSSPSNFNRVFKKMTRKSPSEFSQSNE
jgi:AraC-like DNA-binding protein